MNAHHKIFLFLSLLSAVILCGTDASAKIVTYPAPVGEAVTSDYTITVEGKHVDVYAARTLDEPFSGKRWNHGGPYTFANFDMSGSAIVRITSAKVLRNAVIRPRSAGITPTIVDDHTISFTLDSPKKISIEPDGKKTPLLLFANALENDAPKPGDPGVIYFGPGIHRPGMIRLGSNQTLYLAGGAVVKGEVLAAGSNIRIRGRGILDGSDWAWKTGPVGNLIAIRGSHNVEVKDITLRGSSHWTLVPRSSDHITVRNVKICNSRVQNDDGINPCNSQDVLITDCFIRSDDDCIALKGTDLNAPNNNVERITVENTILWCDRARIFLLGHESRAKFMRDIKFTNLDIIHFAMTPFLFEPGEEMRLENVLVENVRINGEGQRELIRLRPTVNQYMNNKVPGYISNVTFHNVRVDGQQGGYTIQLQGADQEHTVRDVVLDGVFILRKKITADSAELNIGPYTSDIRFN